MSRLPSIDRREVAGAFADVGVLVPIAVALIVTNGLSPTAVLLPAGLMYLAASWIYRLPVPVQPLKAFGAIAIANGHLTVWISPQSAPSFEASRSSLAARNR